MPKIVFFGTPEISVPSLEALCAAGLAPALVVSRPDRPVGRGHKLASPPLVEAARGLGLEVRQPERVRDPAFLEELRSFQPDVAVVIAYGRIFPEELLSLPRRGCVNIHASLLPRHRGASPIQAAILAGDRETGCCLMVMEVGLDTGPVFARRATAIGPDENAAELSERLGVIGGELLAEQLPGWIDGTLEAQPQPEEGVTFAPLVQKHDGRVDWSREAAAIRRQLRAYTPWPGLITDLGGSPIKLVEVVVATAEPTTAPPGQVTRLDSEGIEVACGHGSLLLITSLQRPGRRAVAARDLLNSERLAVGMSFGS